MPKFCYVLGCKTGSLKDRNEKYILGQKVLPLFKVPKDELYTWRKVVPMSDKELTANDFICSEHFRKNEVEYFFEKKLTDGTNWRMNRRPALKKCSVPSIFPQLTEEQRKAHLAELAVSKQRSLNARHRRDNMLSSYQTTYEKVNTLIAAGKFRADGTSNLAGTSNVIVPAEPSQLGSSFGFISGMVKTTDVSTPATPFQNENSSGIAHGLKKATDVSLPAKPHQQENSLGFTPRVINTTDVFEPNIDSSSFQTFRNLVVKSKRGRKPGTQLSKQTAKNLTLKTLRNECRSKRKPVSSIFEELPKREVSPAPKRHYTHYKKSLKDADFKNEPPTADSPIADCSQGKRTGSRKKDRIWAEEDDEMYLNDANVSATMFVNDANVSATMFVNDAKKFVKIAPLPEKSRSEEMPTKLPISRVQNQENFTQAIGSSIFPNPPNYLPQVILNPEVPPDASMQSNLCLPHQIIVIGNKPIVNQGQELLLPAVNPIHSVNPIPSVNPISPMTPITSVNPIPSMNTIPSVNPIPSVDPIPSLNPIPSVDHIPSVNPVSSLNPISLNNHIDTSGQFTTKDSNLLSLNLEIIKEKLSVFLPWTSIKEEEFVSFLFWNSGNMLERWIVIDKMLRAKVFLRGVEASARQGEDYRFSPVITSIEDLDDLLFEVGKVRVCKGRNREYSKCWGVSEPLKSGASYQMSYLCQNCQNYEKKLQFCRRCQDNSERLSARRQLYYCTLRKNERLRKKVQKLKELLKKKGTSRNGKTAKSFTMDIDSESDSEDTSSSSETESTEIKRYSSKNQSSRCVTISDDELSFGPFSSSKNIAKSVDESSARHPSSRNDKNVTSATSTSSPAFSLSFTDTSPAGQIVPKKLEQAGQNVPKKEPDAMMFGYSSLTVHGKKDHQSAESAILPDIDDSGSFLTTAGTRWNPFSPETATLNSDKSLFYSPVVIKEESISSEDEPCIKL